MSSNTAKNVNGRLSLLEDSPVDKQEGTFDRSAQDGAGIYDEILEQAVKWIGQMESLLDSFRLLQVQNAIILDELAMAGADD